MTTIEEVENCMLFCFLLQNWIMTTLKFFLGPRPLPKNLAIFFLAIFGFACEDQKDHYEESATLSYYQYSILADLHNHTDWDCLTDVIPLGTIHISRIAQILI